VSGPTGASGPAGPSNGFFFQGANSVAADDDKEVFTSTSTLPAGDYLVTMAIDVTPSGGSTSASCTVIGSVGGGWSAGGGVSITTATSAQVTGVGTLHLPSDQKISFLCEEMGGAHGYSVQYQVGGVRVGTMVFS
jgi:hypothetical protein